MHEDIRLAIMALEVEDRMAREAGEIPQNWYFTFGYDHVDPYNGDKRLKDMYVTFHGTWAGARAQMFHMFGQEWSFQYNVVDVMRTLGLHEYQYKREGLAE
jgi:hypothetical protein